MISLIEQHRQELDRLCAKHRVRRLAVFGSALGNDFDPDRSDLDFAVEFEPLSPSAHADAYFGLLADLEDLFGKPVDLVEYEPIRNPYFLRSVLDTQVAIYG